MALAINSFPVPVSPWIRTAESTGAILFTSVSTARNFGLDPIKSEVVIALFLCECEMCLPFPLIKTSSRYFPFLCLVIHSRTYGSQFTSIMLAASH